MSRSRGAAVTLAGASLLMLAAGDLLVLVHHLQHGAHGYAYWLEGSTAVVTWAAVGLVLAIRVPGNPLGWLALLFVVVGATQNLAGALGVHVRSSGGGPGTVDALAALAAFCQLTSVGGMVLFAQLIPTGRPASRRWRPVMWLTVAGIVVVGLRNSAIDSGVGSLVTGAHTPFTWLPHWIVTTLVVVNFVLVSCVVLTVAGVVSRWRRGSATERQQLKWVLFAVLSAVGLVLVVQPISSAVWPRATWIGSIEWAVIGASVPVGTAVAILRYRLYDIDRIVSRTVSYAVVTGLLVGVYVGLVALTTDLLPFSSSFGVAASTLAAAGLFQPVRRRVQMLVDHRFDRARYDATRTVEAFSARLRDQVDVDVVRAELVQVVTRSVAPTHVSLWVTP